MNNPPVVNMRDVVSDGELNIINDVTTIEVNSVYDATVLQQDVVPIYFNRDATLIVKIGTQNYTSLIDSGSSVNLISACLLPTIDSRDVAPVKFHHSLQIRSVNGSISPVTSVLKIQLQVGNQMCEALFCVAENIGSSIILGRPFLERYRVSLNFEDNSLKINGTYQIKMTNDELLSPGETCLVQGLVVDKAGSRIPQADGLAGMVLQNEYHVLQMQDSLVTMCNGLIPLIITNHGKSKIMPCELEKGISFEPLGSEDILFKCELLQDNEKPENLKEVIYDVCRGSIDEEHVNVVYDTMNQEMSCADLPGELATVFNNEDMNYTGEKSDMNGQADETERERVDGNVLSFGNCENEFDEMTNWEEGDEFMWDNFLFNKTVDTMAPLAELHTMDESCHSMYDSWDSLNKEITRFESSENNMTLQQEQLQSHNVLRNKCAAASPMVDSVHNGWHTSTGDGVHNGSCLDCPDGSSAFNNYITNPIWAHNDAIWDNTLSNTNETMYEGTANVNDWKDLSTKELNMDDAKMCLAEGLQNQSGSNDFESKLHLGTDVLGLNSSKTVWPVAEASINKNNDHLLENEHFNETLLNGEVYEDFDTSDRYFHKGNDLPYSYEGPFSESFETYANKDKLEDLGEKSDTNDETLINLDLYQKDYTHSLNKGLFGPNLIYTYEDNEIILKPKQNPYASVTLDEIANFPKQVCQMIDMEQCVFKGKVLQDFKEMIDDNYIAFQRDTLDLGFNNLMPLQLVIREGAKLGHSKTYKVPANLEREARDQLELLERLGVIRQYFSDISSPAFLVKKACNKSHSHLEGKNPVKAYKYRLVCDMRQINKSLEVKQIHIAPIADIFDRLGNRIRELQGQGNGKIVFSSFDLTQSFFQLAISENSQRVVAFTLGVGSESQYAYTVLPQGLSTSSGMLSLILKHYLRDILNVCCQVYADDILIYSPLKTSKYSYWQHINDVNSMLRCMRRANLKLHPRKAKLARFSVEFLGTSISSVGCGRSLKHQEALATYPVPSDLKALRTWLGLAAFFSSHIKDRGLCLSPLYRLLRKDVKFQWGVEEQSSFQLVNDLLISDKVLSFPKFTDRFELHCDSSMISIGSCLLQRENDKDNKPLVIGYYGRGLSRSEKHWNVTKLELFSIVRSVLHFKHYLYNTKFIIYTDHKPLTSLLSKDRAISTPQYSRWALIIQQFDFEIRHKPGTEMRLPDCLSRREYELKYDHELVEAFDYGAIINTAVERRQLEIEFQKEQNEDQLSCNDLNENDGCKMQSNPVDLLVAIVTRAKAARDQLNLLPPLSKHRKIRCAPIQTPDVKNKQDKISPLSDTVKMGDSSVHGTLNTNPNMMGTSLNNPDPIGQKDIKSPGLNVTIPLQIKEGDKSMLGTKAKTKRKLLDEQHTLVKNKITVNGDKMPSGKSGKLTEDSDVQKDETLQGSSQIFGSTDLVPIDSDSEPLSTEIDGTRPKQLPKFEEILPEKEVQITRQVDKWWPKASLYTKAKVQFKDQISPNDLKKTAELLMAELNIKVTLDKIKEEQKSDVYCRQIYEYMVNDTLPLGDREARRLMIAAHDYMVYEDTVFHVIVGRNPQATLASIRIVLPKSLVLPVLYQLHESYCHVGISRLLALVRIRFVWINMSLDISRFVSSCPSCIHYKRSQRCENPPYSLKDKSCNAGNIFFLDLLGELPQCNNRCRWISVVVDFFSKYCIITALRNKSAALVAKALYEEVFTVIGPPRDSIRSDSGREFDNKLMKNLAKLMGYKISMSHSYTPISQHCVERLNSTLMSNLRALVNRHPKTWSSLIKSVQYSYNCSPIQGEHFLTPYFLQFGRMPPTLGAIPTDPLWVHEESMSTHIQIQHENIRESHRVMLELIRARQLYDKKLSERTRYPSKLEIGSICFLKVPPRASAGAEERRVKLEPLFKGPYVLTTMPPGGNICILTDMRTGISMEKPIHFSRIKYLAKLWPPLYFAMLNNEQLPLSGDHYRALVQSGSLKEAIDPIHNYKLRASSQEKEKG